MFRRSILYPYVVIEGVSFGDMIKAQPTEAQVHDWLQKYTVELITEVEQSDSPDDVDKDYNLATIISQQLLPVCEAFSGALKPSKKKPVGQDACASCPTNFGEESIEFSLTKSPELIRLDAVVVGQRG
ncbi:unnamed protein product [Calypogeia fissa]